MMGGGRQLYFDEPAALPELEELAADELDELDELASDLAAGAELSDLELELDSDFDSPVFFGVDE